MTRPIRFRVRAIALVIAALVSATPSLAGWSADPTLVHATSAHCPQVAAVHDGTHGAIVVWQENSTSTTGPLYAQRLLATGDVDPAWPAPLTVTANAANRIALGGVPDGYGGAFVWWMQGTALYLTRVAPGGTIAPGWPAGGRILGALASVQQRPAVFPDGAHGVWLGWIQLTPIVTYGEMMPRACVAHLTSDNTGAAGGPAGARQLAMTNPDNDWVDAASFAPSPDGGAWVAYGTSFFDPGTSSYAPGDWRLVRLQPRGTPAPGWASTGVAVAPFDGQKLDDGNGLHRVLGTMLVGVAGDGAQGAYLVRSDLPNGLEAFSEDARIYRYDGTGAPAPGWPASGLSPGYLAFGGLWPGSSAIDEVSLRAFADGTGGVYVGTPVFADHGTNENYQHVLPTAVRSGGTGTDIFDPEIFVDQGALGVSSFYPSGPYGPYSPIAYISASIPGASYSEYHPEPVLNWYGDIALTSVGNGSAIFAWSQERERFGIYAVLLGAGGRVTGVDTPAGLRHRLALRFERGIGVRAIADFDRAGTAHWSLFDVSGRQVAADRLDGAAGVREWSLAGTERLPAGLYFARVTAEGRSREARVVVTY